MTDTDTVADKKRKRIVQINTKSKSKVKLKPLSPQNPCFSIHIFKHRHFHFPTQTLLLCSQSTHTSYPTHGIILVQSKNPSSPPQSPTSTNPHLISPHLHLHLPFEKWEWLFQLVLTRTSWVNPSPKILSFLALELLIQVFSTSSYGFLYMSFLNLFYYQLLNILFHFLFFPTLSVCSFLVRWNRWVLRQEQPLSEE